MSVHLPRGATTASRLRLLLNLRAQTLLLRPELRSELGAEVLSFKDPSNLDLGLRIRAGIGAALDPFDRIFQRLHFAQLHRSNRDRVGQRRRRRPRTLQDCRFSWPYLSSLLTPRRALRNLSLPRPEPTPPNPLAQHQELGLNGNRQKRAAGGSATPHKADDTNNAESVRELQPWVTPWVKEDVIELRVPCKGSRGAIRRSHRFRTFKTYTQ